ADRDGLLRPRRQEDSGRAVEDAITDAVVFQRAVVGGSEQVRCEDVLGPAGTRCGDWRRPLRVEPVVGHVDAAVLPVVDFGSVDRNVRVALDGGADNAPRLPGTDDEVVIGVVVAPGDAVLAVVGVADRILVIDLVAAAVEDAALVHLDDVAGTLDHPLDAAAPARLSLLVIDGGDQDVLRLRRAAALHLADDKFASIRLE